MNTIAIIMARGGSKGLPRKNVKLLAGKPLIAYTIEHAIASGVCDEVIVTTEDDEIAEIAKEYGANVPFLRSENSINIWLNRISRRSCFRSINSKQKLL